MWNLSFLLVILLNLLLSVLSVDEFSRDDFPLGFVFGSGTSAYQVEGAANEDGRTPSIWDTFAHAESTQSSVEILEISGNSGGLNGDIACDGYHKYKEDVQLMVDTGLDAYRFSISWSRLIPNGRGPVNPKGLQYYNNLINELINHEIVPHVTLHNYDLPQALEDEYGGWVNRKIVKDFTAYADVCFMEFGDRVPFWTTVNEPNVFAVGSYDQGISPPKHCSPPFGTNCTKGNSSTEPYLAAHHLLLSHASAATLYKKKYQGKQNGFVGLSVYAYGVAPFTNSTEDALATQRFNDFFIGWVMHPLVFGDYPSIMRENVGSRLPTFTDDEAESVKGSFDFIGLIHYFKLYVKDNPNSMKLTNRDYNLDAAIELAFKEDDSLANEFPIDPSSMQMVLEYFKLVYGNPPIYIYENGQSTPRRSSLEDTSRVRYMHAYIGALLDALRNGSNTIGYFSWSFMDVFELLDGYGTSYGLYYVDFDHPDRKRHAKLSAHWYSHFLKGTNITLHLVIELQKNLPALSRD